MKLTTKGRYAVTAMLDLALNSTDGPVSLAEISSRQEISLSYLEQLFAKLRRRELVVSTRGPGGGYSLSRASSDIPVGDIISAVDESVDATNCGGKENCRNHERCLTHDLWMGLTRQIAAFLQKVSLQDLIDNHSAKSDEANGRDVINPLFEPTADGGDTAGLESRVAEQAVKLDALRPGSDAARTVG